LLPTFRVNGNWQSIDPHLQGRDVSVEVGHSLFSIKLRRTNFEERNPADSLRLTYGHIQYRLSYGNTIEVGLGLGRAALNGNIKTTGTSFTLPLFRQLGDNFGFEFVQTYSDFNGVTVSDFDGSLMYFKDNMAASIGYRVISNPASSLSGPYLGISFIY